MKIAKDCTPQARRAIGARERLLIDQAEPREAEASFEYANGWTCRIRVNRKVVGEAHRMFTIVGALTEAIKDMHAPESADGMTEAKREYAIWRDTEVEVA